ncbi:hypothetical protein CAPTEDRAFT_92465 [Capitella teleta]|uniref:G-protein coupled receptors family 1 profile domain-containing protein n=1 Tax=Capitella teleta TaxID=283909 RepID=R7U676_CAPTE|nr:hypothetical protein CAPTEDRAFT_92465 [Capitella teleta]|eukprot:ELU01459.1 hypothetical protein CAPTEDRAFT_92465 [Capitella teleta]
MEDASTYAPATGEVDNRVYCPNELGAKQLDLLFEVSAAISVLVVVLSLLVVIAICLNEKLRDVSTPLVVSLAIADMTFGLGNFFFYGIYKPKLLNGAMVKPAEFFMTLGKHSSMLHLVMIGVDRALYITRPFKYITLMTKTTSAVMIAFPWAFGLTTALCSVLALGGDTSLAAGLTIEFGMYLSVVMLLIGMYGSITKLAIQQRRRIVAEMAPGQEGVRPKSKVTKMLVTVLGCFVLLWSPYFVYLILRYIMELPIGYLKCSYMKPVCDIPSLINSAANVIIYSLLNQEYRKTFSRWVLYCYQRPMPVAPN